MVVGSLVGGEDGPVVGETVDNLLVGSLVGDKDGS
jgi:hypothetical protein